MFQIEKQMEVLRTACQTIYKKLSQCTQSHGFGDLDKRLVSFWYMINTLIVTIISIWKYETF